MPTDDHFAELGLSCPGGGDFYVCAGNSTEFIGCCTSDPCADGSGSCPSRDLRASSFDENRYASIPEQSCNDRRGARVWYTCRDNDPPFLGCCASNPCGAEDGCPQDHLLPSVLSKDEDNRLTFLPREEESSAPASSAIPSPTGEPEPEPSESGDEGGSGSNISTGAIAGISIGAAVGVAILLVMVWKCGWLASLARKRRDRNSRQGHMSQQEMGYNPDVGSPGPDGPRDSHFSFATTVAASSHHTTPASPDFSPKPYAQHFQHQQPPHYAGSPSPPTLFHPLFRYQNSYSQSGGSEKGGFSPPQTHPSHMTNIDSSLTAEISEIDGVERDAPRVELPADEPVRRAAG